MATVNTCTLSELGVTFEIALQSSSRMFASVIEGVHGGMVLGENDGKPLEMTTLINVGAVEIALRTKEACSNQFDEENKKQLDAVLKMISKIVGPSNLDLTLPAK